MLFSRRRNGYRQNISFGLLKAAREAGYISHMHGTELVFWILSWPLVAVIYLKGRPWLAVGSFFGIPFCWWAAFRLAKPGSWWAERYYDDQKMNRAIKRFGAPGGMTESEYRERLRTNTRIRDTERRVRDWGSRIADIACDQTMSAEDRRQLLSKISLDPRTSDATRYEIRWHLERLQTEEASAGGAPAPSSS